MNAPLVLALVPDDYDDPAAALRPHWSTTDDRYADLPARFIDVDDDFEEAA